MIKVVDDVGAPLAVAAVNIAGRTAFPDYHDWVVYGMTALGYLAAYLNWGGNFSGFLKQMGVSSMPLTADKIYERIKGGTVTRTASRTAFKTVSRARVAQTPGPGFKNLETY